MIRARWQNTISLSLIPSFSGMTTGACLVMTMPTGGMNGISKVRWKRSAFLDTRRFLDEVSELKEEKT